MSQSKYHLCLTLKNGETWLFDGVANTDFLTNLKIWLFDLQTKLKINGIDSVKAYKAFENMIHYKDAKFITEDDLTIHWTR